MKRPSDDLMVNSVLSSGSNDFPRSEIYSGTVDPECSTQRRSMTGARIIMPPSDILLGPGPGEA